MSARPILTGAFALTALVALAVGFAPRPAENPGYVDKPQPKVPKKRPDRPPEWAQYMLARRVVPGESEIRLDAYAGARTQAKSLPRHSAALGKVLDDKSAKAAPRWEFLGPTNVAGRARALAFDPRNADRILIGGVSGGIWESTDTGASWRPLSQGAENINIGALAWDTVDPKTIYAGTGELYRNSGQPYSSMWGSGILVSRDDGATWSQLDATATDDFRYVADVVISRHDHNRLYAATNTGLWQSDDGGVSFRQVLKPADASGKLLYEGCNDLEVIPDPTRDRIVAACSSRSTYDRYWLPGTILPANECGVDKPCPAAVFLNEDAANAGAWTKVLSEPAQGRTIFDVSKSNPNIVYALSASIGPGADRTGDGKGDYDNGLHALFRSDDGGRTWDARLRNDSQDKLSTYLLSYADGFDNVICSGQPASVYSAGWYNMALAVDPVNPDVVWAAGMEHFRSDDGGRTFGKASWWWIFGVSPYGVHADQHFLEFDPRYDGVTNKRLFSPNDGGLAITDDSTRPTRRDEKAACGPLEGGVEWRAGTNGLGTTQFYTGAVTADGSMYVGGLQDNGTQVNKTVGQGTASQHVFGGDGASVAIDPRNSNTFYVSYQNINIHRTDDGGKTFVPAKQGIGDVSIFIMPYILDPNAPDRLYAGGSRLWRTNNKGAAWQAASAPFGTQFFDRVSAIAVAPNNANRMLVGNQKKIFWSANATNAGPTTAWQSSEPRLGWVSSLSFDATDSNIAYATYSSFGGDHVYRSSNGGATWAPIDGTGPNRLPDIPVHTLAVDPNDRQKIFVGTDLGVFVTADGGANWAVENTGFENTIVESLKVAPNAPGGPMLYAFTYGRGVWRAPIADFDGVATYDVDSNTSGAWYDPAQNGQGFLLETIDLRGVESMAASWYTYVDGKQRWLIGAGPVVDDEARIPLFIAQGGDFPPTFDPADVSLEPWGFVELSFDDASNGRAEWSTVRSGFASGSMPLRRLSSVAQPVAGESANARIAACHSGTWYNTAQGGHGVQVQVTGEGASRRLLGVWYAFVDGEQRWLIGDGAIVGDSATMTMITTSGADFPPDFRAGDVVTQAWGTLTFRAIDGDSARIEWSSALPGFSSGAMDLSRLTAIRNRACD